MPKAENLFKVLQLGTRLKQLRMQEEERAKAKEDEGRFLESISDNPDLVRAYRLSKGFNLPAEKVFQLSGLMTPAQKEERKTKEMVGDLAHLKSVSGPGILKHIAEHPETPPETKGRMLGLRKTFPGMVTGYEEPQLKEAEAGEALRVEKGLKPRARAPEKWEWEISALATPPSKTPIGERIKLQELGYTVDEENDGWLPPTQEASPEEYRKRILRFADDFRKEVRKRIAGDPSLTLDERYGVTYDLWDEWQPAIPNDIRMDLAKELGLALETMGRGAGVRGLTGFVKETTPAIGSTLRAPAGDIEARIEQEKAEIQRILKELE